MFTHQPHPHVTARRSQPPPQVADEHIGLNGQIAVWITRRVSTMYCAYAFLCLSLVALPAALTSGNAIIIVSWISQTLIQLVFLPILSVGQDVQAKAADKRAVLVWHDTDATLHEIQEVQRHLAHQDAELARIVLKIIEGRT